MFLKGFLLVLFIAVSVTWCVGAHRGQKGAVDPLQLELGGSGEQTGSESFSPLIVWLQGPNSVCQA